MSNEKSVPGGVKTISILLYLGAFFGIILGLFLLFGSSIFSGLASQIPYLASISMYVFIGAGIGILIGSAIDIILGIGLWKARNWARITIIVFCFLGVLMYLPSLFMGLWANLIWILIDLGIALYLLMNKRVKESFA